MQKLDPKAIWIFFFRFLFSGMIFFIFISVWLASFLAPILARLGKLNNLLLPILILMFILMIVCLIIFCWIWAKLTYRFWKYQIAEDAFKKESGIIWKKYISIPYERIQNVDIYRGIIDRILGLSRLQIQTAGYSAVHGGRRGFGMGAEGCLPGLSMEIAEQLREELVKKAKGKKQGL